MLVKSDKFIPVCVLCFILISKVGICSDYNNDGKIVKEGYNLVETLYSCITSDILPDSCNDIFYIAPYRPKNEIKSIFAYLHKNKELFITNSDTIKDTDFFKWSRKTVSYYNPKNLDKISDGNLYITVVHTLSNHSNSGIYKEIAFPIVKEENTGDYKIQFFNIKVNGILIDYENDFIRDFDIVEALGFKPATYGIKPSSEVKNRSGLSAEQGAMK